MNKAAIAATVVGLAALLGLGGWWYWANPAPTAATVGQSPIAASPTPAAATPPAPPEPAEPPIRHPLVLPAAPDGAPATPRDVESMLGDLFGRKAVLALFQTDDFARRVAATVDNLGRSHAPAGIWPVRPADGRFLTERRGDTEVIDPDNGRRYAPYVQLLESTDAKKVFAIYLEFYPRLQRAYEELGYPGQYFNDRLVAVLDQLIATPVVDAPIAVRLPEISGPTQPQRPWVLYEFEDPALRPMSAGQKWVLRTGPDNARRIQAKLAELRRLAATGVPKQ